jgi:hypothetical protein
MTLSLIATPTLLEVSWLDYFVLPKKLTNHLVYVHAPRNRSPLIVSDDPAKQRILAALSDEYSRKILTATIEIPMSALELSKKYEIPITTVYPQTENGMICTEACYAA